MPLPPRLFYTLIELETHWTTAAPELHHWLINGDLLAVAWLPIMSVVPLTSTLNAESNAPKLCHWEGFIQLSGHQCRRLFRNGRITLREFTACEGAQEYQLPEPSDDISVGVEDVVILEQERRRFEARYPRICTGISHQNPHPDPEELSPRSVRKGFDPSYRSIHADGHQYYLGELQARIIRILAEAAQRGKPWQSGKALLQEAGSQSYSLSNVFKRHPVWKTLIQSDRRGYYRLNEAFIV